MTYIKPTFRHPSLPKNKVGYANPVVLKFNVVVETLFYSSYVPPVSKFSTPSVLNETCTCRYWENLRSTSNSHKKKLCAALECNSHKSIGARHT